MNHKKVSIEQYESLEILISNSRDITTDEAKRVILWLLRQSKRLSRPVCVSIPYKWENHDASLALQVMNGIHDMNSCRGTTHIHNIFRALGSKLYLSSHYGKYVDGKFHIGERSDAYTIWLTRESYGHCGEIEELAFSEDNCASEKIRNNYGSEFSKGRTDACAEFKEDITFA